MSIAHGRLSALRMKPQSAFATPATDTPAYVQLPYYTQTLGLAKALEDDPVLSQDGVRDPSAHAPGLPSHDGQITAPVDLNQVGFWLRMLLGAPTTTDDTGGNYTHVFKSGAADLPFNTVEMETAANVFLQHIGVMAESWSMSTQRQSGYGRMDLSLVGREEKRLTNAVDADAPTIALERVPAFTGVVKIDDALVASITEGNFTYANNLEGHEGLDAEGLQTGYDTGVPAFTGGFNARFVDTTLYALAETTTAFGLEFVWSKGATKSLTVKAGNTRLERTRVSVNGPNGISVPYSFKAATDPAETDKAMVVVTLKNQIASYEQAA